MEPGEPAQALKQELMQRLGGLIDEEKGERAINEVFETWRSTMVPTWAAART